MDVSFVIPCFQEEAALAVFRAVLPEVPAQEIVFVDDGSTDGTAAALAQIAAQDPRVVIETHAENRGVGAAMRSGIARTRHPIVVVYDVDRTYPLEDATSLTERVRAGTDVAGATPYGAPDAWAGVSWFRRMLSGGAARAYRWVLGRRSRGLTVFTCAFRAYRGERVRALTFRSDGFPAAAEILGRLLLSGASVVELPSTLRVRTEGESKMRVFRTTLGHLGTLGRLLGARLRGAGRAKP